MNGINWDSAAFFERLTSSNRFAREHGFRFTRCSSLEGFHDQISTGQNTTALVAVSDTSAGKIDIDNTPHTRRVKTVFLFMRHKVDDMAARQRCLEKLNELFRQFASVLIREKTRLDEDAIYIDSRIEFHEIDKYFFTGGACAFFQIFVDTYTDLRYNPDEWTQPLNQ